MQADQIMNKKTLLFNNFQRADTKYFPQLVRLSDKSLDGVESNRKRISKLNIVMPYTFLHRGRTI